MKELNILEILKLGLIGLGFLLALLSYYLLRQELKRETLRRTAIAAIRFFMFFSLGISILAIVWEIVRQPNNIKLFFDKKEVQVSPLKPVDRSRINSDNYYINSEYDFAFKKMEDGKWSTVNAYNGLDGFFDINFSSADSLYKQQVLNILEGSPIREMVMHQRTFQVEKNNSTLDIVFTDSSTSDQMDMTMRSLKDELIKAGDYDLTDTADMSELNKELQEFKNNSFLSMRHLRYKNQFVVSVLEKQFLPPILKDMSLAEFFKYSSSAIPSISEILAYENTIFVKGVMAKFKNVLVNNKLGDFQSDKLLVYGENKRFFYILEIAYSPQTNESTQVWDDLQELLSSFVILKN